MRPKLIVFASGTKDGGGSGFENLVNATKTGELDAEIVAVVSNHEHDAVKAALDAGDITESGPTMHFATEEFDRGPIFFEFCIPLRAGMSADDIARAVNAVEHEWQPRITNMVVHGKVSWDGKDSKTMTVPAEYEYFPKL